MNLAPIGLSTYSRLGHLKQTVEALQKNTLAKESELYIFSDAPQKGDEAVVEKVRSYIRTVDGFKKVNIIERTLNGRVANNRGGFESLLDRYNKAIFLEDDIVTAPGFLSFMNEALEFYKNNEKVISISGYTPPIVYDEYKNDCIHIQRHNSWGMGMWKDRMGKVNQYIKQDDYHKNIQHKPFYEKLVSNGIDIPAMLKMEVNGVFDALDVKIMYYQTLHDWYTVNPKKSLVQNIGHDGSGLHCGKTDRFHHDELWEKTSNFDFLPDISVDERILAANYRFRSGSFKNKMKFHVKNLLGLNNV